MKVDRFAVVASRSPDAQAALTEITSKYEISILAIFTQSMSFLKELWMFVKIRKKFWLLPIIFVLSLLGFVIFLTQGTAGYLR